MPGPARFGLVHLLCPFGKAFYGDVWKNRPNPCPRKVNMYAKSKGRRREAVILIQHMVRWRLTRGRRTGTNWHEMDRSLMKRWSRGAQISLCANSDEPRDEIVPSCGFLQGDVTGLSLCNDVYSEQIAKWGRHCEKTHTDAGYLHAKCFFSGDIHDASSTIFADDITKRTVTNTSQEVNHRKEEHQVGFVFGHVDANVAQRGEMARQHGEIVPNMESPWYTVMWLKGKPVFVRHKPDGQLWDVSGARSVHSESNALFSAAWSVRRS